MSSPSQVDASLAEVETLLAKVGAALKASKPEELKRSSMLLRDAALRFSQLLEIHPVSTWAPAIVVRVRTVGVRLASQRDALARISVMVDRQVATVLPDQVPASTYGPRTNVQGTGIARLYRSAS